MNKNIVVVHGSYFINNFGDTLLIKLLCDRVAQYVGKDNVRLATKGMLAEQVSIGYPIIDETEINDVSDVFYSGGGYFGEPDVNWLRKWRWSIRNYRRHFAWSKSFSQAKLHIIGVGVGPIENVFYRYLVGNFFCRCETILVRDNKSLDFCIKYFPDLNKPDVCVDLALGTPNLNLVKNKVTIHLDSSDNEVIFQVLTYLKNKLSLHGVSKVTIVFDNNISFNEKNIKKYTSELENAGYTTSEFEFIEYEDYDSFISILSSSNLVITSKLHAGIVTISQRGKVIAIPNHSKTLRLYSQLSLSDYCIERDDFDAEKFDAAYKKLNDFLPNYSLRDTGIALIDDKIKHVFSKL
jgi:hypothetical protein